MACSLSLDYVIFDAGMPISHDLKSAVCHLIVFRINLNQIAVFRIFKVQISDLYVSPISFKMPPYPISLRAESTSSK